MTDKQIGKITSVTFGMGGYDDAMLGVSFALGNDSWGIGDFRGTWSFPPDKGAKWSVDDQTVLWGKMVREIGGLLEQAKVSDFQQLVGKPVEVTLEDGRLKSWRLLTEAI